MRAEFINEVCGALKIESKDIIEKDMILHELLHDLSKNNFFSDNYLFKGGICLTKHYLGYFRFSEDIDFTWMNQGLFEQMSKHEIRRYISPVIGKTGVLLEEISQKKEARFQVPER